MDWSAAGVTLLALILCANNPTGTASEHIWHNGPINCYTCSSLESCSASLGAILKCEGSSTQGCVAVFNANGVVIQRGCSEALEDTCSEGSNNCYECRSNGCNNLSDNSKLIQCVSCDAQNDDACVFDIELITERRQCHEHCMTALYPRTSDQGGPLELVRSCLDDLDLDDRENCADSTAPNCVACSSAGCNTVELGVRRSCNRCTNGECSNPQPQTCRAVVPTGYEETCFIEVDELDNVTEMGCSSQYNVPDLDALIANKRLWLCSSDNCNVQSALPAPQSCKLCSSRTDPSCALAPEEVSSEDNCNQVVNTDCYVRLLDSGHTERGCVSRLEADDYVECWSGSNDTRCSTCSGNNCNEQLHPADRLACHVCSSSDDASCESVPASTSICLLHLAEQQCVSSIDADGNTQRGCSGSLTCDISDRQHCQFCNGTDCNTDNLKRRADGQPGLWGQTLPLSCQICNSVEDCASNDGRAVCLESTEYCMTVFDGTGVVQARGCSNEIEEAHSAYCDANPGSCHNCNSQDCNGATSLSAYEECIYCDSVRNPNCAQNPSAVTERRQCNRQCMTAWRPRSGENISPIYDTVRSCLDDKDPADQASCSAGNDLECRACTGAACNTEQLPESTLSCYSCEGDACMEPSIAECQHNSPADKCYILFDTEADVKSMGCYSDLDASFVETNIHLLLFCDSGNNCNFFDIIPESKTCRVCNSIADENCAVDPALVQQTDTCTLAPHTNCVTFLNTANGSTQRGCLSDLSTTNMRACLLGTNNCSICEGEMCNVEIYPADRRRCHRCNSRTDPSCESSPSAASVCPRYREDQGCSAKLVNSVTYRGCETEFTCDDSDKQHCRNCATGDNCNVANLFETNIGYPGKWQTPPINCYTCEGTACQGDSLGSLQKCAGNDAQNCATIFASNGSVVLRGCSDLVYNAVDWLQYCDESPESCKFCKSTGCNNARELDAYENCRICDGQEQDACVTNAEDVSRTTSCQGGCFTGLYPRNNSEANKAFELSRGCLDDLELDDRVECQANEKNHCVACTGAECNVHAVPETRLRCNYCSDVGCETVQSQVCTAYREQDQCYIHVGDLRIESMGCASDLEEYFLLKNRRDLQLCNGDNCNDKESLNTQGISCNYCNSSVDASCVGGNAIAAVVCQHYLNPECITHITEGGVLVRGCLMDADDNLYDDCLSGESETCKVCNENNCNKDIFPEDWHTCVRCDSNSDIECEKNPDLELYGSYCPSYSPNEACVTRIEKTRTRRGCLSELSCDASETSTCRICDENNCNVINLLANYVGDPGQWTDLPLSCYVCDDEESCAVIDGSGVETCEGNNKQVCSTIFGANGNVIARGCSDTVEAKHADYCDANMASCFKCKSNECNNAVSTDNYIECFFCDSHEDPNCVLQTPSQETTRTRQCHGQCMQGLYPRSSALDSALIPARGCLDDLNASDRELCIAGDHPNCVSCSDALCNNKDPVEEPHACFTCVPNTDCVDIASERCVAYRPNDQCYLAFDDLGIVAMGCSSEFETQVTNELVAQQKLLLCDEKNCNIPSIIPDPNTCSSCSSEDDARCATNPNQILEDITCSNQPYTQCVTRINNQGTTVRGCLSSLNSSDFYNCLTGTDELCEICEGDRCNGLSVFPANRRKCHQCDSSTDSACAASPSSSRACPIFVLDDTCVTTQRGDVTYRGCGSSLSCDNASDSRSCRICSSDSCNTINLEQLNADGSPGIWQDVPISCLSCSGSESCATGGGQPQTCEGYQNCITVFDEEGVVIQRGCSAQVLETATQCEDDTAQCPRCNSNNCNVADSLEEYVECLVCDSSTESACVQQVDGLSKIRRCHEQCMTALRPIFGETNDAFATVRNCYDDMEKDDREACAAGTKDNCVTCAEGRCNSQELVESRHSCFICTGDDCQSPQANVCPNYREDDQCYIEFNERGGVVGLGCLSQYSHADILALQRSKRLLLCQGTDCNTLDSIPEAQTCTLCSSRTDKNCATSPSSVISETTCDLIGLPECYSRVLDDGSTERGCLSNLEDDEFLDCYNGLADTCDACRGNACNKEIYPENRASCQICDSQSNALCESAPNSLSVCPIYVEGDTCVTNYRSGVTYRACSSSLSCDENSSDCVKCVGDGCNTVDLAVKHDDNHGKWQDLPLTCLSCQGAENCVEPSSSLQCQDNNEQDCITVFNGDGVVVARGCADSLETECAANGATCHNCKSNECNNANALSEFEECIYCDSFKDDSCLLLPESSLHKTRLCHGGCMTALYGSADAGQEIIRTCLNDKEEKDANECQAGSDANCVACTGAKCNVDTVPEDRMSCYICEGDDCEVPVTKSCPIYKQNDKCFIWVDEDNSIKQLGCLSSFRNQDLESVIKTKRIAVCDGENCNVPQLQVPTTCAVCDSRDNVLCATNAVAIDQFDICTQMPHTGCVSRIASDGSTNRGCLYDLEPTEFAACLLGTDENCSVCNENGCNREIFPADRLQCFTCSSEDDVNCESYPIRKEACAWVSDSESCFTHLADNVTARGCSSSLQCDTDDFRNCRSCVNNECNGIDLANRVDDGSHGLFQPLPLSCHVCSGDHCLSSLGPAVKCTRNDEQDCKTVFEKDGQTVLRRGCAEDVDDYEDLYCRQNPDLCFSCKSNECNSAWSISEYVTCAFCNSETDPLCVTNPEDAGFASRQCQGQCMVALVGDEVVRTCLDDKEEYDRNVCSTDSTGTNCARCTGEQCNKFAYPKDRLRCHVCTGDTCSSTTAEYCRVYNESDSCIAKYQEGNLQIMGCASDQSPSDLNQWRQDKLLYECEENECNDLNRLPQNENCLDCDSSKNPDCAQDPTNVTTTELCNAPQSECVTLISGDGHTIRGCLGHLSSEESSCVANGTCAACAGQKCNLEVFPVGRQQCHICNSVADSNCVKDPNHLQVCPIYVNGDSCVTKYGNDGYLERGCVSDIQCEGSKKCEICESAGCNTVDLTDGAVQLSSTGLVLTLAIAILVSRLRFSL
ncbi:G surface protein, allelic form 156 [Scaptodrosophila lebanonensis]|uniref:G surface protein, allelic form 156 n=1 Tax=Drosophila lebanonensis TaxID=7225 RepID=A0A6J2TGG8_DROLE|nr:G surface protein, allelic form 156 [Scaptodrosophila lebanonensis]